MNAVSENVIIFVTTTPIDIKPNTCPANSRHAYVGPNFAIVRRGVYRPQTK